MRKTNHYKNLITKTEDDFIKYQRKYAAYLRQQNTRMRAGRNVDTELKKIERRWLRAGLIDSKGKVKEQYVNVITKND